MIEPTFLVILSWLLVGSPLPPFIGVTLLALGLLSALKPYSCQKTIALTSMMSVMFIQCILLVFAIHVGLGRFPNPDHTVLGAWLFPILFAVDLRLAELGAIAAICFTLYVEFANSRLDLAQAFRDLRFFRPTDDLMQMTGRLARDADIKCPEIRLLDSGAPSAFTIRTRHEYTIAVSVGLLESFDSSEVEACIAHEISHIKNRDFALRSIATFARVALFTRPSSYFLESAIYRAREFLADRTAALLIGGPRPLISALTKLQQANYDVCEKENGNVACCFDGRRILLEILSKHPALSTRIRLLREIEPCEDQTEK